jgi:hypothetical protein
MNNIEELFVPYEESLALKELEFDEPCIARFNKKQFQVNVLGNFYKHNSGEVGNFLSAPLFSQAFKFFKEQYGLEGWVTPLVDWQGFVFKYQGRFHKEGFSVAVVGDYDLKKQAELECLKRLIKIVKENGKN